MFPERWTSQQRWSRIVVIMVPTESHTLRKSLPLTQKSLTLGLAMFFFFLAYEKRENTQGLPSPAAPMNPASACRWRLACWRHTTSPTLANSRPHIQTRAWSHPRATSSPLTPPGQTAATGASPARSRSRTAHLNPSQNHRLTIVLVLYHQVLGRFVMKKLIQMER